MTTLASTSHPPPWRRWALMLGVGLFSLAYLAIFLADLSSDYSLMLVPCQGEGCNFLAISSAEIAVLESWGLSIRSYANFMTAATVVILIGYWLLSALILWRQGTSRAGLIISLGLIVLPVATAAGSNDWSATHPRLFLPAAFITLIGSIIMLVFFYLLPNGRFSPRWALIPLLIFVIQMIIATLVANSILHLSPDFNSILEVTLLGSVLLLGGLQIYRYARDSTPLERQQTKWIVAGLLSYMLGVVIWALVFGGALDIPAGAPRLLASIGGWFSNIFTLLSLPAAIAIAILRYRLWDIDLLIRRTVQYALLTGVLVLMYFGGVILLQTLFGTLTGEADSPIITVITTLTIAALFNPLRTRIQSLIDRRFFRQKYNAERILAAFAATARDEVDMDRLVGALLSVVEATIQPEETSLWIKGERG